MKANKFIKEFGWDLAKRDLAALGSGFIKRDDFLGNYGFDILDDLKTYVEAYELVGKYESLSSAKSHLDKIRFNIATKTWFGQALLNWSIYAEKLDQAITLVEECQ